MVGTVGEQRTCSTADWARVLTHHYVGVGSITVRSPPWTVDRSTSRWEKAKGRGCQVQPLRSQDPIFLSCLFTSSFQEICEKKIGGIDLRRWPA